MYRDRLSDTGETLVTGGSEAPTGTETRFFLRQSFPTGGLDSGAKLSLPGALSRYFQMHLTYFL